MSVFRPVQPASPVAAYVGGKKQLARHVIAAIDAVPHRTYAEPLAGNKAITRKRNGRLDCQRKSKGE
jgi:DNA adenine methylase